MLESAESELQANENQKLKKMSNTFPIISIDKSILPEEG
jgi:hypothetical protein